MNACHITKIIYVVAFYLERIKKFRLNFPVTRAGSHTVIGYFCGKFSSISNSSRRKYLVVISAKKYFHYDVL